MGSYIPSNLRYKKYHKIKLKINKVASRFICPHFADYGLQSNKSAKLTAKQIESVRRTMKRFFKKNIFLKVNFAPYSSLTKKPVSARMGKGKGRHDRWVAPVYRGKLLLEITKPGQAFKKLDAMRALRAVSYKLPIRTRSVRLIY